MSWVRDSNLTRMQRFAMQVIKCGSIPNHLAFIMDGSRRFSRKTDLELKIGYAKGFDKLFDTLQWCLDLGIKILTVYGFSIENFKRSQEEVDLLFELIEEKFAKVKEENDKLRERGICIRVVGRMSMLPISLQRVMAEAILLTKDNSRFVFNFACPYTSRDEMTESIRTICNGIKDKEIRLDDISEELIRQCMYTNKSTDPDLLVRTSGETRLSDFLLYQCSTTVLYFSKPLWPEYSVWQLLDIIFYYHRNKKTVETARQSLNGYIDDSINADAERIEAFLSQLEKRHIENLENLVRNAKD